MMVIHLATGVCFGPDRPKMVTRDIDHDPAAGCISTPCPDCSVSCKCLIRSVTVVDPLQPQVDGKAVTAVMIRCLSRSNTRQHALRSLCNVQDRLLTNIHSGFFECSTALHLYSDACLALRLRLVALLPLLLPTMGARPDLENASCSKLFSYPELAAPYSFNFAAWRAAFIEQELPR
jgi:hypothetical protein